MKLNPGQLEVFCVVADCGSIRAAARRGVGVLLISSELDELIAVADRCPVHRTLETGSRFEATEAGWEEPLLPGEETPA